MRFKGTLAEWNDDRGFGFIDPAEGGARVFCHISAFQERSGRPSVGKVVTYEAARDERGRPRARQIRYAGNSLKPARKPGSAPHLGRAVTVSGLFVALIAGLAGGGFLTWIVPLWYLGWSGVLFLVYGWDKTAAESGRWRTKEATLNSLALVGDGRVAGSPSRPSGTSRGRCHSRSGSGLRWQSISLRWRCWCSRAGTRWRCLGGESPHWRRNQNAADLSQPEPIPADSGWY